MGGAESRLLMEKERFFRESGDCSSLISSIIVSFRTANGDLLFGVRFTVIVSLASVEL
jgi:hypothetical protein